MFNEYFHSTYTPSSDFLPSAESKDFSYVPRISAIELSVEEVQKTLQNLDPSKAHGPNGIPSRLLVECASQLSSSIHYLFNKSLALSQIPVEWKLANIVPLHKNGKKDHVENDRPISLLSIISKVLERCVFNHISNHIQSHIHSAQYGFANVKSCTSQLLSVLNTIGKNLDKGLQSDVVLMDISKAFDTVDHSKLLQKLRDFGFSGLVLMWFRNYLSDRSKRVTVNGVTSTSMPITSGVPQGSILGPFLFSVYINDLPSYISTSTGMGLFADDVKCYRCIRTSEDGQALQEDILGLYKWSNDNNPSFNIPKCKVLSISRKVAPFTFPYNLNRHQQIRSNVESDLGITLHSKLLWNDQVNKVRSKANKLLRLIRRSTLELTDVNARKFLCLQLVRSNFTYASQV